MTTPFRKKIRVAFWILSIVLGAAQAWVSRFDIINDTISYLDMGDYFFHGHPAALINGIWSPLYAFLLGATLSLFKPSLTMEYPVIHLLLFIIFLFALVCFEYFLCQMERLRAGSASENQESSSGWSWITIAYVIFLWSSLGLVCVYQTNPDMLIAAFFYLSCGLLIKISEGQATWKTFLGLGVTLGMSYLTKGVMFPLSLLLLATAWFAAKQKSRLVLVSVAAFLIIATPYIAELSAQKGHLTFGESGKYNYAVHVNGIALHHWQGDIGIDGVPIHPTREIVQSPATFEFKGPLPGTYPAWFDPTFWYDGVTPHVHAREQIKEASRNLVYEFKTVFYALNGVLFATLFLAYYETRNKLSIFEIGFRCWYLIIPSLLGTGLYALVHYETRYVGPFFVVLGVCFFSCVLWVDEFQRRRLFAGIAILQFLMFFGVIAWPAMTSLRHPWTTDKGSYQEVAEGARKMGLRPGDQIASLDFSNLGTAMWARLARIQIIAEVYYWPGGHEGTENDFWKENQATQDKVLHRLLQTGAKAVVSSEAPTGPAAAQWSRIGNTGYYLLWLNSKSFSAQSDMSRSGHAPL
jgi:hypothetical protein